MIIGNVGVMNPVWVAPMAGISVPAMRRFHCRMGAGLAHTEMVSAAGLMFGGKKTKEYLRIAQGEGPLALQLFGSTAGEIARGLEAALKINEKINENNKYAAVQINMACPMPKVIKKGSGAALLRSPDEACRIVTALLGFGLPVWIKIRLVSHEIEDTAAFVDRIISCGAHFVIIHGRTQKQRYEGIADAGAVCAVAKKYPDMIGGTGDVYTPADAAAYLNGGCAAVLAARGLLKNPLLIYDILKYLNISNKDINMNKIDALLELGEELVSLNNDKASLALAKRMSAGVLRDMPGAAALRNEAMQAASWGELRGIIGRLEAYYLGIQQNGITHLTSVPLAR